MKLRTAGVLLMLLGISGPSTLVAEERIHRVEIGETPEDIAERYWGNARWADLLRTHNGIRTQPWKPGLELRVPMPTERIATAADTWWSLARATLGDVSLGPLLAELNEAKPSTSPQPGQRVRVPALLIYRMEKGDTLAAVARRFLEGKGGWGLLARLNRFGNPHRLQPGDEVRIPVFPPVEPAAVPTPAIAAAPPPSEPVRRFPEPLEMIAREYREGRYEEARARLEALRPEVLASGAPEEQIQLLEYLTLIYVAFDNEQSVCEASLALKALDPGHDWDPSRVSPKVARMTSLCESR
jgi:LysM repeat protein